MKTRTDRGFTLLETVVSIAIIGVLVVVYTSSFQAFPITRDAKFADIATHIAQTKMDSLRAGGYASLPGSGSFSDPLLSSLPSGVASTTITSFNASTKQINVGVSWIRSSTTRYVTLTTLVTQTGGL